MKKATMKMTVITGLIIILSVLFVVSAIAAEEPIKVEEPEYFWAMDEDQSVWIGENSSLDFVQYDHYYEASAARLYSVAWAGRYGGVAIQAKDLDIPVSGEKNRYLVVSVMPDDIATDNQFDNLHVFCWKQGEDAVKTLYSKDPSFSKLYHAPEKFQKIIIDLKWEEEFTLQTLRLDIFSTKETAVDSEDGYGCGLLLFEYIALFDTLEDATNFEYGLPNDIQTQAPTDEPNNTPIPTSEIPVTENTTERVTAEPTLEPFETIKITNEPDIKDKEEKSPIVGIVLGIVIVILITVIAIVLITKPKKK